MTDDTPRDPLAAQPLTDEEIADYRRSIGSMSPRGAVGADVAQRLLATLDATRPSGDEALRRWATSILNHTEDADGLIWVTKDEVRAALATDEGGSNG